MINYVSGDILLTQADAIAHGIAPGDDFKQGLALSLRERWPSLYKDFRHFCHTTHPKEGSVWSWKGAGGPVVINMMTQEHAPSHGSHAGKATLSYVNRGLRNLVKELQDKEVRSLAITKVSTGVGGLDWQDVKPLIESALGELDIPVYVYETYQKDAKAEES